MITVRKATLDDVEGIRDVFQSEYANHYAYPQYYDTDSLARLVYADGSVLLVAVDTDAKRVAGTASVVFSVGSYNDLIGEFGRLVVHPDFRGRGIGNRLMEARIQHVKSRLHLGIVENRSAHTFSQRISSRYGFVPVGFVPMKLLLERRESVAIFVQYFNHALTLRRNNPRIIPEASSLAGFALKNCDLPQDAIIDDTSAPYPHNDEFELDELETEGYASLLRIERGRLRNRDVFGPVRLHYGLFQLRARHSHYLIARRDDQVMGGIGFMIDHAEKAVRVFELISVSDEPIRFLVSALLEKCQTDLAVEYVEVDVSAYSPRMQRTLLELGFLPVSYIPANVFHQVERLDAIKMSRLLVPFDLGELQFCDSMRPIADVVIQSFASKEVLPRISVASQQTPLFDGLSDEQRQRLLGICIARFYRPGQSIYHRGEKDGTMHLILAGEVSLLADDSRLVANVSTGQCVSETSLLFAPSVTPPHTVNAVAKTAVETATFSSREFSELIRRRPDIGVVIYRNLAVDISTKLKFASEHSDALVSPMHWPDDKIAIRDAYEAQGFAIVKQLCDQPTVEDLRHNLQRYISDVVPQVPPMDVFYEDKDSKQRIRMLPRMDVHDAYFRDLLTTGPLREIAEFLCGEPVVPRDAAYFNKLPEIGEATPAHQDGFYFHLDPCHALTLWLALDDVDEQNGCVRYVVGSHRRGMREHARTKVLGFSQGIVDFGTEDDLINEIPACVSAGDLIVHDAMTIHRTDVNHSPRSRRALGLVYFSSQAKIDLASSARYQEQLARDLEAEGKI